MEYIGLVVVVIAIMGALVATGGVPEVGRAIGNKICQAVGGSCGVGQGTDGGVQAADPADDHPALPVARAGDDAFAYQVTGDFEGVPVALVFKP